MHSIKQPTDCIVSAFIAFVSLIYSALQLSVTIGHRFSARFCCEACVGTSSSPVSALLYCMYRHAGWRRWMCWMEKLDIHTGCFGWRRWMTHWMCWMEALDAWHNRVILGLKGTSFLKTCCPIGRKDQKKNPDSRIVLKCPVYFIWDLPRDFVRVLSGLAGLWETRSGVLSVAGLCLWETRSGVLSVAGLCL